MCVRRTDCEDGTEALSKSGDNFADFGEIHREIELGEAANGPRRQETEDFLSGGKQVIISVPFLLQTNLFMFECMTFFVIAYY